MEFSLIIKADAPLLQVLQAFAGAMTAAPVSATASVATTGKAGKPAKEAKETAPVVDMKSSPEVTEEKLSMEDVRKAVLAKKEGHKDQIKSFLGEFGAANVASLDKQYYGAFLQKVKAL